MSVSSTITKEIQSMEKGVLFSYENFISSNRMETIASVFSRLVSKGIIKRFAKGKYYKPQSGIFGEIPLKEEQIIESLLREKGKQIGYLTGTNTYNRMGLTTQIANEYVVAVPELRRSFVKGRVKVRFVKSYCKFEEKDVKLLQLLDAIKDIRSISGTEPEVALDLLKMKLKQLPLSDRRKIVKLAMSYPPATRALTGSLLELVDDKTGTQKLLKSLNFLSKYKVGVKEEILPNKQKWKIE